MLTTRWFWPFSCSAFRRHQQKKALRYGILGAFFFRAVATLLAVYLIELSWVKLAGAAYLLYLPYAHFSGGEEGHDRRAPKPAKAMLGLTAFWATVVKVELTDIVFAIDSILVAVAMSNKTWVILTGGILGIIAMRLVIGKLLALIQKYPALVDGAFVIIAWVGHQAAARIRAPAGPGAFRDSEVDRAGPHRRDLRDCVLLRAKAPARRGRRGRGRAHDVDQMDNDLLALAPFEFSQRPALPLVRGVRALHARAIDPFDPAHLFFIF